MPRGRPKKQIKTEPRTDYHETDYPKVQTKVVIVDKAKMGRKQTALNPEPFSVYDQCQTLMQGELQAYEDSSRMIKQTLTRCFQNYVGSFAEPTDPYTKRKKIFDPLTHNIVDSVSKPVKIDSKAIRILPLTEESKGKAKLLNMVLPYFFQQMGFDEIMNNFVHRLALFGAQVTVQDWLYEEEEISADKEPTTQHLLGFPERIYPGKKTKKVKTDRPRIRLTNVMDIFCPATADSLPWAVANASVIIRSTLPLSTVQSNPIYDEKARADLTGWTYEATNNDDSTALNKFGMAGFASSGLSKSSWNPELQQSKAPFVTLYERYGKMPKSWITGDDKDSMILVPGIVTCASNNGKGSDMKVMCVRLSPFGDYGPFEEAHFNKLPNRWCGEGLAERLIALQAWKNEIINTRRNNELLTQQRMFVYRKGSLDPSQLYSRPAGGIAVESIQDIQWLPTPDVAQSSFAEDSAIDSAAQRLAGAAQVPIQKKVTATEASLIQATSNLTYNELRDTMEMYMERLVLKHLIPLLKRFFKSKKTIPIKMEMKELEMLDTLNGYAPFQTEIMGDERFLLVDDSSIFDGDFAVTVDIDSVPQSRQAQAAALTNMLALSAKIQNSGVNMVAAFRKIAELNGIVDDRLFQDAAPAIPTGVTNPVQQAGGENPLMGLPPLGPQASPASPVPLSPA